ncbi:tandem-95 repeat protein [Alcanivorax sp.]|uniref:beta strand repeat-containing protein n=1 Tax=Alcanivorax sp. TaxID=1872427 RepID=UPI002615319F|nr:tandem-95 repeat protein [Alcanivorax sp.]
MGSRRGLPALLALVCLLGFGSLRADFIQIDGFVPVMPEASRGLTFYPLPATSTTTNGATFTETGGRAKVTLGGNGNTAGALLMTYTFPSPIDLTDGGTNTQFFLVMDRIFRAEAPEGATALSVTITARDTSGVNGTYNTGIGNVPDGQSLALNFNCSVNPTCFSPQPNFSAINRITVRLAFPTNYAGPTDITEIDMDSVYVTPTGGSFPPVFTSGGTSATFREGTAATPVVFAASGVPEPVLTQSGTLPAGVTWDSVNYRLTGTPATGSQGIYHPVITATNSAGSAGRSFTLFVEGPPTITSAAATTFSEGLANSFSVTADGYPAPTYSVTAGSLPDGVTLSSGGTLSGTPVNALASYPITITADNGVSPADNQSFTLTVNRAPRVTGFTVNGLEDTPLSLSAGDFTITEPDGESLSVSIDTLPANGTLLQDGAAVSAGALLSLTDLNSLAFVPDTNWHGSSSFNWRASDGTLFSPTATATLTIASVNDAPVIGQGTQADYITDEDAALQTTLTASDVESDPLNWSVSSVATNGQVEVAGGNVSYTPSLDFHGLDSFVVSVSDGNGGIASHTFNVTINPLNDAPVITQGNTVTVDMDEDGSPTAFALTLNASDIDDDLLSWSLQTPASEGTANASGNGASPAIDYQPAPDYSGSDSFVVRVADGNGGNTDITVTVNIAEINDAPTLTGPANISAVENVALSVSPTTLSDVENDTLTVTASGLPAWASLNNASGEITGTPGADTVGQVYVITLSASDGQASSTLDLTIEVLADLDGDTIADIHDDDIDGDGMSNDFETTAGLDPRDPGDAGTDLDGDGTSNLDEFLANSDPSVDDYAPLLGAATPVSTDSTGLFTLVQLGTLVASDGRDRDINTTPDKGYFAPGQHLVERSATDNAGNTASTDQTVSVTPQISFGPDPVSAEGASVTLRAYLNGPAAQYPVTVPYTLSGSADSSDHDLAEGDLIINAGTEASLTLQLTADGSSEGSENLQVIFGTPGNAVPGFLTTQTLTINESNVAPVVQLQAEQNGETTRWLTPAGGPVTVTATIEDANGGDSHTLDWSASSGALVDTDGDPQTFTFDPALLGPGQYTLAVTVNDGSAEVSTTLALRQLGEALLLGHDDSDGDGADDLSEGFADRDNDGVPDYLDAIAASNVLQGQPAIANQHLLETEPGLQLSLGDTVLAAGNSAATISAQALLDAFNVSLDNGFELLDGNRFLDVRIAALGAPQRTAYLVVPQARAIEPNASFQLFANGGWQTAGNVASARGAEGYCPSPGSTAYRNGLNPGDWCVRVGIRDGSAADADRQTDARIAVRGGIVSVSRQSLLDGLLDGATGSSSSSGIGSVNLSGLLLLLGMLGLARRYRPARAN